MIVVAIMAIVMGMSIPLVRDIKNRGPFRQAIHDVEEVCRTARAQAIMRGSEVSVVFHPVDGTFSVSASAPAPPPRVPEDVDLGVAAMEPAATTTSDGALTSGRFAEGVNIEMLDINMMDYRTMEAAGVRFYPNGTCDELTLIITGPDGAICKIDTEATTGLTTIEFNPSRFK
jgi:hypothetical protein